MRPRACVIHDTQSEWFVGKMPRRSGGWRIDPAAYAAVPLLSDGSEGAPLELRGLFKQFLDEVAPRR